ncbi:MAG: YIP1 family protein [Caldisericaceae bacterium]|nr:YIP1 family protein [Caldisericaceae bacterium]
MNIMFELIWLAITHPKEAFKRIREKRPLYAALILLLIYGIVSIVTGYIAGKSSLNLLPQIPESEITPYFGEFLQNLNSLISGYFSSMFFFVFGLITPYLTTFISTAIYDLIGQFFVKKGAGITLFIAWSFAAIPMLIYKVLNLTTLTLFSYSLPIYIELIFIIWSIYMYITAIKETYEINTGLSIGIYFAPIIVIFVLLIIYMALLFPLISKYLLSLTTGII